MGTMERVIITETPSQKSNDQTDGEDKFEEPLNVGYNRKHASSNTSNNAGYNRYNSLCNAGEFNNKIARALSLRDAAFETASFETAPSYTQPTRQSANRSASTTDYSTIKEYELANNFVYTDQTDQDDKSSMASVSIIASTNQQAVTSAAESAQSTMAKNAIVPYPLSNIEEYERRMSTQQAGFTAEVCKLINGHIDNKQSASIGMFRLRLVKYRIRFRFSDV